MAIEWGLLSQGLDGPTPYEQQKSRNMQAQLQQQQLAGAQSQTRASEMQLQQMIESSNRTKKFAETIAQKGGDPGDWMSVAQALHDTGDIANVQNAQKMVQDFYEADKLASLMEYKAPPSFDKWLASQKARRTTAQPAAVSPAAAPPAAPAAAAPVDINALAAGANMPVNNLIPAVGAEPAAIENKLVPGADNALPVVETEGTIPLTSAERIAGIAQTKKGAQLANVLSKLENPSEYKRIEDEITTLIKQGVPETDNAIKSRRALLDATVYGKDPEYAGYIIAKGEGYKGGFIDYKKLDANLKRVREAPAAVTPVTIVDPNDPTKTVVVDARTGRQIGEGLKTSPGADLTPKDRQTREAKYPQATLAVKTFESKADKLAKDLETLANHPGLGGMSGPINGRTGTVLGPSTEALALYDSIVARGGFDELAAMRNASPTGGALGNVSNQEGQYLRDAFAAINRTQKPDSLAKALRAAAENVRAGKGRVREAYDATYEYREGKSSGGAAALPPGFVPDK